MNDGSSHLPGQDAANSERPPNDPQRLVVPQSGLLGRIRHWLTEPSKPHSPFYQYGMLAFSLALLGWSIWWRLDLPPHYTGEKNLNLFVALMLSANHLAYSFRWPVRLTVTLRLLSVIWQTFVLIYIARLLFFHPS